MSDSTSDSSVEYHRLRDELLCDIGRDTDKILAKLEHKGTNMDTNAFLAGQAVANNNRGGFGNDAALMLASNGGMGNMWNNPFMYLIWLAMFGYGNGFNGRGGAACCNQEANAMLLQAISQGSNTSQRDIDRLAAAMGCGQGEIRNGLNVVNQSLCQIANTLGMSVPQIVNAIQAGDAGIIAKMQECCCENRLALCQQNNLITSGFAQAGFQAQQDKQEILNRLDAMERARMQEENNSLKRQLDRDNLAASVSTILQNNNAQSVALGGTLSSITQRLEALAAAIARIPTTAAATPAANQAANPA